MLGIQRLVIGFFSFLVYLLILKGFSWILNNFGLIKKPLENLRNLNDFTMKFYQIFIKTSVIGIYDVLDS